MFIKYFTIYNFIWHDKVLYLTLYSHLENLINLYKFNQALYNYIWLYYVQYNFI